MDKTTNQYKCTQVAFAAFLETRGFKVKSLEIQGPGKGTFIFEVSASELNKLRCEWNDSPESLYSEALSRLKSLTY